MLDISKVEAGELPLDHVDFDLVETIETLCEVLAVRTQEKRIEFACHIAPDVPRHLVGDSARLSQILFNLVGNAIKFTEEGEVVLRVWQAGEEATHQEEARTMLAFSVRDTGIGIPTDRLTTIFDKFTQAEVTTTRRYGGTGLGLTISRMLVDLMGGTIEVESTVGHGSTFTCTLPFKVQAEPQEERMLPAIDLQGIRILVVDDHYASRLVLKEMLIGLGCKGVGEAMDGRRGLQELNRAAISDHPYDLVLLDNHLPDMTGIQVAEEIRQLGEKVTILMLTSDRRSRNSAKRRELDVVGCLVKPVKRVDLQKTVLTAVGWKETSYPEAKPKSEKAGRSLRILVADDAEENLLVVESFLKTTPYRVDTADNGRIATEKFQSTEYDLVLMDMQMPVMDGYTATRLIREWEKEAGRERCPILALSAYAMTGDTEKSIEAGCDGHLAKPIRKKRLLDAIFHHTLSEDIGKAAGDNGF